VAAPFLLIHRHGRARPTGIRAMSRVNASHDTGRTVPVQHNAERQRRDITVISFIIYVIVIGLIAGAVARLVVPGTGGMGIGATIVLGIVGSLVGGFLGYVIFGKDLSEGAFQLSGLLGSIIGAIIALLVYRAVGGKRVAH
jgi:uncharacterized membrane protein YeaQ/YmgE (transglycosylase-associated protein family)